MSIFFNNQIVEPGSEGISLPVFQPESGLQIPEVDAGIQESIDIQNDQEFANKLNEFSQLPETNEFRPKLAEHLSAYRQRTLLDNYRDPALTADEKARRKKAAESLDLLRDWDTDELARKRVEARWGKGFIERVQKASPEDRDEMLGMRLMVILGDGDGYKGHNEYNTRNSLWGQGVVTSAQVWQHFQASNKAAIDGEANAIRSARSVEQQLPTIAEELWKGNSMLQVLDKMPELDASAKVFLLTNCGYGSQFYRDVEDARQWAAKNGIQLSAQDKVDELQAERNRLSKTPAGAVLLSRKRGFSFNKSEQELSDKVVFNNGAYELGKKLVELKANNENAFNFVVGSLLSKVDRERNSGTAVLSPLASTFASMMESSWDFTRDLGQGPGRSAGLPAGMNSSMNAATDLNFTSRASDRTSDKEAEVISQIRAIKQSVAESPDGASWWRRFGDGLGRMAAQTAFFVGTQGVGTFTALSNDRIEELRGQGVGEMEATLRGFAAGGTEVLVERLGGESLFKTLRLVGLKMPSASRFAGYMGSATDMMRRGLYKSAAARYGTASLASGGSEWLEEIIQPTLQVPLDAGLARLFGSENGMTVEDWKEQLGAAADPMLALQMVAFGAVAGGAQIPAFAREAQISRVSAPKIMSLGVQRAEAERIANIVDPVEKNREIFQAALSMSDRAAQLENVRQGFSSMQEDYSWLARQEAYQAEVELLNLPRVEDLGDGHWKFTTTVRDTEGQESYDVLELGEQDATARMQALLHDGVRLRMLEAQQAFAVDRTIRQLEGSGKYVFEDMGRAETVETARKLAEAARLRITEGADVNAEAADLGTRMTYGQAASMDETFKGRVQLGVERGEVASAKRARSHAYRVAMRNGQTLIRFHKGEVTVPELLEEVLETHLTEDMGNTKHSLDWYANNLRALQDALRKEGYLGKGKDLIRKDGEVSVKDVIEGMSMLAKGDVLARAADMRLPQWMKDFLQMVRQWVSSAKALLDLGAGLHEMERRRLAGESVPIDADFAQTVYALSNNLESYWMQEGARQGKADVQRIVEEVAGSSVSMSMAEDSSVSFSIVSIPESDVVTTAADMRARLKPLQGKVFVNKNTGIQAMIEARVSGKTVGKAGASQMSLANLKALGFSAEEARTIHYTAAARIHELFENAEDGIFEDSYKDNPSRAGAYHFFNTVDIEGIGSFDVNVTAIALKEERDNVLYTLELTIENPTTRGATSHAGRLSTPFKDGVSTRNLSSYRSFVEKEKASIKKKALADGTFMKAPNGANTNLTEDQWLSVRTKAFKNWFGDWENAPEDASKVVDENGEPKVVYHGTPNEFTVFGNTQQNDAGWLGKGYYFYGVEEESHGYMGKEGGHLMALFLNIRDPYYLSEEEHDELVERDDVDFSAEFTERIREDGYDGVYYNGDLRQEWMALDSNQIKSVTNNRGTYDPKNPDITFSVTALDESGAVLAPEAFVTRPDGNPDWFTIPKRKGQPAIPVRLLVGEDRGFHRGYGLTHIAASRNLDELWEKTTPERYISSILFNASELYLAGDREILVKGKRPASWMVLQLEKEHGYYSILTAYPVENPKKKPKGERIPLAERTPEKITSQVKGKPVTLPANPIAAPGAFGALQNKTASASSSAGGGGNPSLPPGARVVNINDVRLRFDDGRQMQAGSPVSTMSHSLSEDSPLAVSRGTQSLEVVHRIAADLRADAATWGRYAGKTDEAAFLVNVGRNASLMKSALMHLPTGYRVAVKPYIDRLQILAELAAKGKIDETRMVNAFARREIMREWRVESEEWREEAEVTARTTAAGVAWEKGKKPTQKLAKEVFEDEMEKVRKAWAENRLHELMAEVMEKAAGKLEALAKDGIAAGMARMLDQVLKVRKKNGKQQKGKVSMEAYTYLQEQVVPLLRMTAEEKEAAMNEAAAELDKLEKENPDQMDGEVAARMEELNEELTRLALYGNLEGMSVDEAEAAAKALETYINTEKEGWAAVQEAAAERLNAIGRRIVEKFNQTGKKADENTLRSANEKFHGKVSFKNFGDFMENMDQLLTRMGKMPALQEFTADMRSRLTNAFQQMRDARGLRAAAVQDLYEKNLTEKVMKSRKVGNMAGWVTWFKTSHDTGVRLNGWITQTAQLTLEQAREVREMDAGQRKEFIRKRWEEGMEYFSEETLDLLLARLQEHEEAAARAKAEGKRPRYRKYVTAKVSFKGEEGSPLVLSRDNALYLVLQSEQEDYREMMKQQGYTPEVVAALREYVGEEGMAIGYGLRELLKAQGDKIGKLYEQVTGVPFPRVENYYPARFWALDAMNDADAADMISGVPSTKGGNQGWQKVRTKHHRRLDTSVGALSVFWEATDITDHWYYTQDITADFRGLLRRREVAESLVANLGKDDFVRLRRWVDLLERAGVVQGQAVGSLDKLLNAVYSGQAKAILAFRFETLMKQGSAVLNAWIGDPSIGFWDYLGTMAKLRNGTAEMGVIKMLKSPEFQARLNDRIDVERLSRLKDDSSYTLAEAALVWGMSGIEFTDVFFNAVGSAALWNIKYRQAVKAGVEEGRAKDEAWQAVRNALHSAQPQTWIDKSFGGLHRGAFGRAIFYMMSENYNKTAAIYGLARAGFAPGVTPKQRWASLSKAGKVWLAYGAFNAIIGAMLDYMKDDEDEWEKRDWKGYLFAALAGPFAGMPLVGEAVEWLFSELLGAKVYTGSAGRALIDFRSGWNAAWKLGEMMQEGGHEAGDYMKQVIRLGRVFGAAGGVASGMTNKGVQAAGQYMTLGAALMNPVKTVVDVVN